MDYRSPSRPMGASGKEEFLNGRNNGRFIKAPMPAGGKKGAVQGSRAYIETRHSEPREQSVGKSSGISEASETISLSMIQRNRVKFGLLR